MWWDVVDLRHTSCKDINRDHNGMLRIGQEYCSELFQGQTIPSFQQQQFLKSSSGLAAEEWYFHMGKVEKMEVHTPVMFVRKGTCSRLMD